MSTNGRQEYAEEAEDLTRLLRGANNATTIVPALSRAADALLEVGASFEAISLTLTQIGTDTARAISDSIAMKRTLKDITEREQSLRRKVAALAARVPAPRKIVSRVRLAAAIARHKAAGKPKRRRQRAKRKQKASQPDAGGRA